MNNPHSTKWYQGKNFNIAFFLLIITLGLAGCYAPLNFFNSPSPQGNTQNVDPFDQALSKGKEASNLVIIAQNAEDWLKISELWQEAIAFLQNIPSGNQNYDQAQNKLREYEGYLDYAVNNYTNPPYFRNGVNNAMDAAVLTQTANNSTDWETIAQKWNLAISQMENVPVTDPNYGVAQKKKVEYQLNLDYALQKNPNVNLAQQNNIPVSPAFRDGINSAMKAATLTQNATTKPQWQEVSKNWENALEKMKQVATGDPQYAIAQEKISQYENNLKYAQEMAASVASRLTLIKTISGTISPKSVVHSGNGLFFAQNMMYQHTITVYNREFQLVKTLSDTVKLSDYGHTNYEGEYKGAPVEVAFSHNGKYAWVSNYQMYGKGFNRPGDDVCSPASNHDHSYLYKINTEILAIEDVIKVGAVPKYVAVSPDNKYTLVTNWCSYDLSIIDTESNKEIKRISLGAYPRGIIVDKDSKIAYIAIMGSFDIAKINLEDFTVSWFKGIGSAPRHLVIDPENKYLYATLNGEGKIAKIDLASGKVVSKVITGAAPRSMDISNNGKYLYVVNYNSNTVSKVRTMDMKVLQTVSANGNPIGITFDPETQQVWVACYSGTIMVFQDGE
jgi:YVTN family beta-propeller protein